ncbi:MULTISPECIES: PcfK-like family protein [Bacteroides]|jgi:hypothetical protein|uniref:PcfK-like family protein n=1 Tax=Bacteroides TaxID=816 RepID=UPI000E44C995|nr:MULTISPECIES: Cas9 inhibitor AcrIIA9 family protein [Bacteroides]RGM45596.1 hypothetical protein DXC10_12845 [Bacteroides sp. OM08-11]DAW01942.1 MAG TPA: PcfK-like protein [Caudoviricetes sp.]
MENKTFKEAIKSYLDERAGTDELFAKSYAKENKNLDECCSYIMGEARKRGNAVAMSDTEVFGLAVHYYDEDDIKVNKLPAAARAVASASSQSVKLTEEDKKKAREEAIKRLTEEQYVLLKKKPLRGKKEAMEVQQMSLF